jgi:hypothetical protein
LDGTQAEAALLPSASSAASPSEPSPPTETLGISAKAAAMARFAGVSVHDARLVLEAAERSRKLSIRELDAPLSSTEGGGGGEGGGKGRAPTVFLVGLSFLPWRTGWKYGEPSFRYTQQDVGHALGALAVSAALLGWQARVLPSVNDAQLASLIGPQCRGAARGGFSAECEYPAALVAVFTGGADPDDVCVRAFQPPSSLVEALSVGEWKGEPNRLSHTHPKDNDWCARPPPRAPEAHDLSGTLPVGGMALLPAAHDAYA